MKSRRVWCGCPEQYHLPAWSRDCPACRGTGLIPPVTRQEWGKAEARSEARLAAVVELLRQEHAKSHPAHADEDDCEYCLVIMALRQPAEGKP